MSDKYIPPHLRNRQGGGAAAPAVANQAQSLRDAFARSLEEFENFEGLDVQYLGRHGGDNYRFRLNHDITVKSVTYRVLFNVHYRSGSFGTTKVLGSTWLANQNHNGGIENSDLNAQDNPIRTTLLNLALAKKPEE